MTTHSLPARAWKTILGCLAFAFFVCLLAAKILSARLWWFGLPAAWIAICYLRATVWPGAEVLKAMPEDRLWLNLRFSGFKKMPRIWPFQVRQFVLAVSLACAFFYGLRLDVASGLNELGFALRSQDAWLRIEFPSYSEAPAFEKELTREPFEIRADTGSYLQVAIRNRRPRSAWKLTVEAHRLPAPQGFEAGAEGEADAGEGTEDLVDGSAQSRSSPESEPPTSSPADPGKWSEAESAAEAQIDAGAEGTPGSRAIARAVGGEKVGEQTFPLMQSGEFAQSISNLYALFNLSAKDHVAFHISVREGNDEPLRATVLTSPVPRPMVTIAALPSASGATNGEGNVEGGKLAFKVGAQSKVPFSAIELAVRTKSGYRFNKALAEFANTSALTFDTSDAQLSTLGIPFSGDDVLYVKAVARTVVSGLTGESRELAFPVKSRQQVRTQVMDKLKSALEKLQKPEGSLAETKEAVGRDLQEALEMSTQLGRQSAVRRQTRGAQDDVEKMSARKDTHAQAAEKKIKAALESLKRQQTSENMGNLFARLQSLKNTVPRAQDEELPKLGRDAGELEKDTQALRSQLDDLVKDSGTPLTLEERQAAQSFLQNDRTAEKLADARQALADKDRAQGAAKSQEAFDDGQKNLGGAMQILQAARARAMKEAREKLTKSDAALEQARGQEGKDAQADLKKAGEQLADMPRLSQDFNEAVNEARQGTREAQQAAQSGNEQGKQEGVDEGQNGIVKALAALQDEEEADREQNQDQDGQNMRAAMDALTAQGQLDVGWRKRILDEIARLRAQGEPSDSPMIRYLESRLR